MSINLRPQFTSDQQNCDGNAPTLGKIGSLETRFARSVDEIRAAQALRYQVFYQELGAEADASTRLHKRDSDAYDRFCRHLLVLDNSLPQGEQIIATYRLMTSASAKAAGGFYSSSEFQLSKLLTHKVGQNFIELGRSCIAKPYRNRRTIELMWQGIWASVLEQEADFLIGCASFAGTDPSKWADGFGWLSQNAELAPHVDCAPNSTNSFSLAAHDNANINGARAFASLPPLLKGYLRVGAKVSSHAVVDAQFGTIDVMVVLDVADIAKRYISHFGADASRFAA